MKKKPQNIISQTALKHYNQFRNVRTDALRWLQINTDTGNKLKAETIAQERDKQLLHFVTIDVLTVEQQHYPDQDIINITMNPIINSYLNNQPISWKLIYRRLLHPSESVTKAI